MKKLLFTTLMTVSVALSAFASGTNINQYVLSNFKEKFKNATNVVWVSQSAYAKAIFTMDNIKMEAFYDVQGELIGTAKGINIEELPVSAKRAFAKKFNGYTVKEVIKFDGVEECAYFFTAENGAESIVFKIGDNEQLVTYKKTKK